MSDYANLRKYMLRVGITDQVCDDIFASIEAIDKAELGPEWDYLYTSFCWRCNKRAIHWMRKNSYEKKDTGDCTCGEMEPR
jgi:hypothetical protein